MLFSTMFKSVFLICALLLQPIAWSVAGEVPIPTEISGADLLTHSKINLPLKKAVVVFLSTECPCSKSHVPLLGRLARDFTDFKFIAVHSNVNEAEANAQTFFSENPLGFSVIQDSQARLANAFGAVKTPHVYVFDEAGSIVYRGGATDCAFAPDAKKQYLKDALEALRLGKKPAVNQTKTLGCYIQRS
jgi:thiol-disulfide isomerase/thioredoxin